jgi:hypothetical protein
MSVLASSGCAVSPARYRGYFRTACTGCTVPSNTYNIIGQNAGTVNDLSSLSPVEPACKLQER